MVSLYHILEHKTFQNHIFLDWTNIQPCGNMFNRKTLSHIAQSTFSFATKNIPALFSVPLCSVIGNKIDETQNHPNCRSLRYFLWALLKLKTYCRDEVCCTIICCDKNVRKVDAGVYQASFESLDGMRSILHLLLTKRFYRIIYQTSLLFYDFRYFGMNA